MIHLPSLQLATFFLMLKIIKLKGEHSTQYWKTLQAIKRYYSRYLPFIPHQYPYWWNSNFNFIKIVISRVIWVHFGQFFLLNCKDCLYTIGYILSVLHKKLQIWNQQFWVNFMYFISRFNFDDIWFEMGMTFFQSSDSVYRY